MKFEFKTDNEMYSKSFSHLLKTFFILGLIIISCDFAIKLGSIARHYQIEYRCRLLSVEKSKFNFKKLVSLSKLNSKQKIWDFCREVGK